MRKSLFKRRNWGRGVFGGVACEKGPFWDVRIVTPIHYVRVDLVLN